MCYPKPGPRCASHAKQRLKTTKRALLGTPKNDFVAYEKAMDSHKQAINDYYMTSEGIKFLEQKTETNSNPKYGFLLDKARAEREAALAAIGVKKKQPPTIHPAPRQGLYFNPEQIRVKEDDYPHPQANRLDKVSTTVDAITGGATTASAISKTLGVVERQGHYYGDAAGYLGFIESNKNGELKEYSLTPLGEEFSDASPEERRKIIAQQISGMPLMHAYRNGGEDAAREYIQQSQDSSDDTVERRLVTVAAWNKSINDDNFDKSILQDSQEGQARMVEASALAKEQRQRILDRQQPVERTGGLCSSCYMQMPLTGECPNCD